MYPDALNVPYVRDLIGVPYKVHGRSIEEGFDCYGLMIEIFARAGIKIPDAFYEETTITENMKNYHILRNLVEEGMSLVPVEVPQKMSIVCIAMTGKEVSHVGVYIGEGMIIHSLQGYGVCVEPLAKYQYKVKGYYVIGNR